MIQSKVISEMWRGVFSLHNTLILRPTLLKPSSVLNQECLQQWLKWPIHSFNSSQILLSATLLSSVFVKVGSLGSSFDCQTNEKLCLFDSLLKLICFPSGHSLVCNGKTQTTIFRCFRICFQCVFKRSGQGWVIVPNLVLYWSCFIAWRIFQSGFFPLLPQFSLFKAEGITLGF